VELVGVAEGESGPLFCVRLMRVDPARSWKGGLWMGLIPGLDHVSLLVFTFFFAHIVFDKKRYINVELYQGKINTENSGITINNKVIAMLCFQILNLVSSSLAPFILLHVDDLKILVSW
jgi:hypothetical protein